MLPTVREMIPGIPIGKILIQRDESTEEKKPKVRQGPEGVLMHLRAP